MLRGTCSVDGNSDMRPMRYPPQPCAERRPRTDAARGFTLVELLVVVAVIGVLVALLLPAVQAARESSRRTRCANNLRQQGLALIGFESQRRSLPVGCIGCLSQPPQFISWNAQILPWLEQASLFQQLDFAVPAFQAPNITAGAQVIELFLCPSTLERETASVASPWKTAAYTDYGGVYGVGGEGHTNLDDKSNPQPIKREWLGVLVYEEPVAYGEVTDGLSRTVACAELLARRGKECEWINGHNLFAQEAHTSLNIASAISVGIGSPHPGGAQVVFCDGHVEFLNDQMEQDSLNAILTRAGEEASDE
jgi:prepilin-type N-terminal cleavage/methylation domain-containing protein/prepilin-type processing-associated H-X9-DG protein